MAATPPVPSAAVQVATVFAAPGMIVGDMIGSCTTTTIMVISSSAAAAAATLAAERYPPHPLLVPLVPTFCDRTVLLPIEMFLFSALTKWQ